MTLLHEVSSACTGLLGALLDYELCAGSCAVLGGLNDRVGDSNPVRGLRFNGIDFCIVLLG
jgi:hypothetical protein